MAARAEPAARADWRRHGFAAWIATTDHKRIGVLYLWTSLVFLAAGGVLALLLRSQLATPNEDFLTRDSYNQVLTMHGTTMIFLVVVPFLLGLATYLVPLMIGARRVAFPRLAQLSFWLYVFGGVILWLSFFAKGGPGRHRLERLRHALDAARAGQRAGLLDPRPARAHARQPRRRDQPPGHDPHAARPRHELHADAAVRLVGARLGVGARARAAGLHGGADDARASTGTAAPTSSTRRAAATPCSSSTSSGSSHTRRSTR